VAALTAAISALNDQATVRAVQMVAAQMGVDLDRCCWLAFGSQARSEQTLVTDQDNGLIFAPRGADSAQAERPAWLAFGQRVNEALAACGYPLCDGRVMAGQPLCCLSPGEWVRRFEHWMTHGSGNDLVAARIYFDVRPLAGNPALAQPLLDLLCSEAVAVPRFIKQLADLVLCKPAPLSWLGKVVTTSHLGQAAFDLKMHGSALFVDAARLWALALRLRELGTERRLRAAAAALRVPVPEAEAWVNGFLTLQRLRIDAQRARPPQDGAERAWVAWADLAEAQRGELKRALRAARLVQQRIELDYCR
jgi:CBS domain-containing protein